MRRGEAAPGERSTRGPSQIATKRRLQIVEATMRSIVKKGLTGTTLASVAKEAGLSQGVAVFYFNTKQDLLNEVLRHLYALYDAAWQKALVEAGPNPLDRLLALVRTDFDPDICSPDALIVWHAFWGEAAARPLYAGITEASDTLRYEALREACAEILAEQGRSAEEAALLATAIDSLTDGLWLRLYLSPDPSSRREALEVSASVLAASLPDQAEAIRSSLLEKSKP